MCSFWSEIEHEMHSLRYKNALSELFQSFKGWKFSGVEKQKKTSDDRKYKKNMKLGSSDHILGQLNHINHVNHTNHANHVDYTNHVNHEEKSRPKVKG